MKTDQSLDLLRQKASEKKMLESKLNELKRQKLSYDREIISLRLAFREEQADVEKLEGKSLANYFYHVIGKLDEKLDRERQEAYGAKVKLDTAVQELSGIEEDIRQLQRRLLDAQIAEDQYGVELERRKAFLKSSGTDTSRQILEVEGKITALEIQIREIREAVSVGRSAVGIADRILAELDSAEGWNTWDMIGGGGAITHLAKHSHLDEAQGLVSQLQSHLRRFKTELTDIRIDANLHVNIEGFLRFADYFFDGLFADWAVGEEISQSQHSVSSTKRQIGKILDQLKTMESAAVRELGEQKNFLENLIVRQDSSN